MARSPARSPHRRRGDGCLTIVVIVAMFLALLGVCAWIAFLLYQDWVMR